MKKYIFLLGAALYSTALIAQAKTSQEPYIIRSLASDNIKEVNVKTSGGSIFVTGVNAPDAKIEVYVSAGNNKLSGGLTKEEIRQRLEANYDIAVSVNNNKVTATARQKEKNIDWKKALSISFKVYVPQNASTNLATSGGSISLENLSGSQDFATSGGSLNIDDLSGRIKGRTSGGSIYVKNSKDNIDLATSGGSIHAENCAGDLKLATSGGTVNLSDLEGKISANTSGGSIHGKNIKGQLSTHTSGGSINLSELSCSLETSTSGGHIEVAMKELDKYVKISNSGGGIDLHMPGNKGVDLLLSGRKVTTSTLKNFRGSSDDDEIKGKLNGGGIPVTVSAGSGRINLSLE